MSKLTDITESGGNRVAIQTDRIVSITDNGKVLRVNLDVPVSYNSGVQCLHYTLTGPDREKLLAKLEKTSWLKPPSNSESA